MDKREDEYIVICNEHTVARFYSLSDALIFLKGCDVEYYDGYNWEYTIRREDNRVVQAK